MGIGNPSLRHPESPVQVKILEGKGGKTHLWFVGKRKGRGKSEETWGSKRFIYTKHGAVTLLRTTQFPDAKS